MHAPAESDPLRPAPRAQRPLTVAVLTIALVTALSYGLPEAYAATGVALAFIGVTYLVALRSGEDARHYGLALGGLMESEPIKPRRLIREGARALAFALALGAVLLPPFWLGYLLWWQPDAPFRPSVDADFIDEALGQLLVIALPEEAFFRGYLQRALDDAWPPRWRVLGADLGPGLVVGAAIFALGHLLTDMHPSRLAVFFPALVFGWLRARTGGIGASTFFHALCNVFASLLARGYGFAA
jgi:uncharacterized protein